MLVPISLLAVFFTLPVLTSNLDPRHVHNLQVYLQLKVHQDGCKHCHCIVFSFYISYAYSPFNFYCLHRWRLNIFVSATSMISSIPKSILRQICWTSVSYCLSVTFDRTDSTIASSVTVVLFLLEATLLDILHDNSIAPYVDRKPIASHKIISINIFYYRF